MEVGGEGEDKLFGPRAGQVEVSVLRAKRSLLHPDRKNELFEERLELLRLEDESRYDSVLLSHVVQ